MRQFQPGQPILHAYLIAAADEQRREEETVALAAAMLCTASGARPCGRCRDCRKVFQRIHPDVIYLDPAYGARRPVFKVAQIREIVREAYIMPSEAQRKVYVLRRADAMNTEAQNALLKLLEEPPRSAAFILAAERAESLLPTVRSRCEILRCNSESAALPEEALSEADEYLKTRAAGDRVACLRWCAAHEKDDSETIHLQLVAILQRLAAHLALERRVPGLDDREALILSARTERCLEYLRANVGARHICGVLSVSVNNDQN